MPRLSIAVAGAGPAGLSAALLLCREGHRVTLFDQFEAPRPLGSGLILQPTGLAVLAELGLAGRILALGRRIDRLFGRVLPSCHVVLDVRYSRLAGDQFGVAVHRSTLFGVLFDAVGREAIAIETRRCIAGLDRGADGRPLLVKDDGGRLGPFDLVVDALGVRSPLWQLFGGGRRRDLHYGALWASLPWPSAGFDQHALEQRYEKASTMIGVLPIGRRSDNAPEEAAFFWSIKHQDHAAWRVGFDAWKGRALSLWPEAEPLVRGISDAGQMTLARYAHHSLARPFAERVVAIGDAAHAASPQLGQGANMALLDAQALALALRQGRDIGAALQSYAAMRRWHMRFYQALSRLFTPFYQSDSQILPPLRDYLIAPATRLPLARTFVAAMVAGRVLNPERNLQLVPMESRVKELS
jgi:2-polyprenyl-6-methoxyphenol hydroxylase-like FAD-dependent oxidoreductase